MMSLAERMEIVNTNDYAGFSGYVYVRRRP